MFSHAVHEIYNYTLPFTISDLGNQSNFDMNGSYLYRIDRMLITDGIYVHMTLYTRALLGIIPRTERSGRIIITKCIHDKDGHCSTVGILYLGNDVGVQREL